MLLHYDDDQWWWGWLADVGSRTRLAFEPTRVQNRRSPNPTMKSDERIALYKWLIIWMLIWFLLLIKNWIYIHECMHVCMHVCLHTRKHGIWKYDHIMSVLRNLHWLPIRQRIIFMIATLMYRCLNGLAPSYLAADCIIISAIPGRRQLRSAASGQLYIPRTRTMKFGPRSFKVSGPTIWNNLPTRMKDPSIMSIDSFRKLLKTFLFDRRLLHKCICSSFINLRGEMFLIIIIVIWKYGPCDLFDTGVDTAAVGTGTRRALVGTPDVKWPGIIWVKNRFKCISNHTW